MRSIRSFVRPLSTAGFVAALGCQPGPQVPPEPPPEEAQPLPGEEESELERAEDSAPAEEAVRSAPEEVDAATARFVENAAHSSLAEVALSRTVLEQTVGNEVRDYAELMVKDHTRANEELAAIVRDMPMEMPAELAEKAQQDQQTLTQLQGKELENKYLQIMAEDHREAVNLFREASQDLEQEELRQWAQMTLPVLEQHLELAEALRAGRPYQGPQAVAPRGRSKAAPRTVSSRTR